MKTLNQTVTFFLECMTASQMHFDMANWYFKDGYAEGNPGQVEHTCGTSACIAGTVAAYIAPTSGEHVTDIVLDWVNPDEAYASIIPTCLDQIFTVARFYGKQELDEVTEELVRAKLETLKNSTWEELHDNLNHRY